MYADEFTPFYFGADQELFGLYYAPQQDKKQNMAILLCASMGQEYIRAHRTNRQLAFRLARAGFPTMRFDYYASGDSAGEDSEVSLARWQADISTALAELRQRSGVEQVSLIGLRLGATLAALVGAQRGDIVRLVAWEPLVSGSDFVEELIGRHQNWLYYFLNKPATGAKHENLTELLGFAFTQSLFDELHALNLLALQQKPAQNILVTERAPQPLTEKFQARLENLGSATQYQLVEGPEIWTEDPDKALISQSVLQAIVHWITTSG